MISVIAVALFVTLSLVALVHVYWGMGGIWPAPTETALARAVVGNRGIRKMPNTRLTLVVAALIFTAGCMPLLWLDVTQVPVSPRLLQVAMVVLALIFLLRGGLSYTPLAARQGLEQPFETLNKRIYAPLCLLIGGGFVAVLLA